jgi:hypothetical protein
MGGTGATRATLVTLLGLLGALKAGPAIAGTITLDPAPLDGSRSADLPETGSGMNERYQFTGTARNDGSIAVQLSLAARANGADIVGSLQTFVLPPQATTQFQYDFTNTSQPVPATVGLTSTSDGALAFVAGAFTFSHAAPVPALPRLATVVLFGALLLTGIAAVRAGPRRGVRPAGWQRFPKRSGARRGRPAGFVDETV